MSNNIRVAFGGLFHETNTYVTEITGATTYETLVAYKGDEILKLAGSALGGPMDECKEQGWTFLPTAFLHMDNTFGMVTDEAYEQAKEDILSRLRPQLPVDVFYLAVHGAGVVQSTPDLEGDLARAVREVVGPETKIVSSTDLHGKVTETIAREYDYYTACKEYPHVDLYPCARDALRVGVKAKLGELKPVFHYEKLPIVIPPSTTKIDGAFGHIIREKCIAYEALDGVLNCSVMHGFPFQDTDFCGMYVLVTTNDNEELAKKIASELSQWIWDNRSQSQVFTPSVNEAIQQAREILDQKGRYIPMVAGTPTKHKPVIIADCGDNPGGGTTGDTTHLLSALIDAQLGKVAFMSIRDPETVDQAISAGVGSTIDVCLGGKMDYPRGGEPIRVQAYVKSISDGVETIRGAMVNGITFRLGPSVRLHIQGIDVIVQKGLGQGLDDVQGRAHGIIVEEYDVVCIKSSAHWRAFYGTVSDDLLLANSPGLSTTNVDVFEHTHLTYKVYPFDEGATYPIQA